MHLGQKFLAITKDIYLLYIYIYIIIYVHIISMYIYTPDKNKDWHLIIIYAAKRNIIIILVNQQSNSWGRI